MASQSDLSIRQIECIGQMKEVETSISPTGTLDDHLVEFFGRIEKRSDIRFGVDNWTCAVKAPTGKAKPLVVYVFEKGTWPDGKTPTIIFEMHPLTAGDN